MADTFIGMDLASSGGDDSIVILIGSVDEAGMTTVDREIRCPKGERGRLPGMIREAVGGELAEEVVTLVGEAHEGLRRGDPGEFFVVLPRRDEGRRRRRVITNSLFRNRI